MKLRVNNEFKKQLSFSTDFHFYFFLANSTNIFIDYMGGKGSCSNTKVRMVIKCVHNEEDDKKIILESFDEDKCYYLFVFNSKLICKKE